MHVAFVCQSLRQFFWIILQQKTPKIYEKVELSFIASPKIGIYNLNKQNSASLSSSSNLVNLSETKKKKEHVATVATQTFISEKFSGTYIYAIFCPHVQGVLFQVMI